MLTVKYTSRYAKDEKRAKKRGLPMPLLDEVLETLCEQKPLAPKHRDHALTGNFAGFRECHILPDWLLIYAVDGDHLILTAFRTGAHADLLE
ncbi:MAG: type II toxin-antitoxin system YafQ family toxin [Peptococcaceae bacterium]|jgi:mRNA interferase YafQ|nr:type II toxin-antitoxin system YafQ family toxin [Peptococcaceae bacterium]